MSRRRDVLIDIVNPRGASPVTAGTRAPFLCTGCAMPIRMRILDVTKVCRQHFVDLDLGVAVVKLIVGVAPLD